MASVRRVWGVVIFLGGYVDAIDEGMSVVRVFSSLLKLAISATIRLAKADWQRLSYRDCVKLGQGDFFWRGDWYGF